MSGYCSGEPREGAETLRYAVLAILFLAAFAVRSVGLLWGGIHPDENLGDAVRVLTGHIVPISQFYPPLMNYLAAAGIVILYPVGLATGLWTDTSSFRDAYFEDPTPFLLVLRLVSAIVGATTAPLAALIARECGLSRWSAILTGAVVGLLPVAVFWSHIGKADTGVAAGCLLAILALLRFGRQQRTFDAAFFGFAVALAFSFKQSSIFLTLPLVVVFLALGWRAGLSWRQIGRQGIVAILAGAVTAIPLTIGVWLDLDGFLDFQRVQAAMSLRDSKVSETAATLWSVLSGWSSGSTLPLLTGFLIAPLVWREFRILAIWIAVVVSTFAVAAMSGTRAPSQLYIAQSTAMAVVGTMSWIVLVRSAGYVRWVGTAGLVASSLVVVLGSFEIDRQALLPPMSGRVATAVLKIDDIEKRRILASSVELTGLPVSGSAMREARARHERIAQKYDVALPKRYRPFAPDHNRYFVFAIPWIIGGLENYEEHEVRVVKPFAWPVQPEEWHLDHWLSAGYTVFLISHEQDLLRSTVAVYRQLHQGIAQRCTAIDALRGDKTLFFEGEVKIYRCDRAQKNAS